MSEIATARVSIHNFDFENMMLNIVFILLVPGRDITLFAKSMVNF
jgi:hypothetical protein